MSDIMLRIAGTANDSIVDGPGIRFTIFTQGCPHHCDGCHNPQTHSFDGGQMVTADSVLCEILANPLLDGVTFSGGEPFCQAEALYYIGQEVKKKNMDIVTFTGFTFEYLIEHADCNNFYRELLSVCDYIIDGKFEIDKKDYMLKFRGSSNQRIIDCKKSLLENAVIETEL